MGFEGGVLACNGSDVVTGGVKTESEDELEGVAGREEEEAASALTRNKLDACVRLSRLRPEVGWSRCCELLLVTGNMPGPNV